MSLGFKPTANLWMMLAGSVLKYGNCFNQSSLCACSCGVWSWQHHNTMKRFLPPSAESMVTSRDQSRQGVLNCHSLVCSIPLHVEKQLVRSSDLPRVKVFDSSCLVRILRLRLSSRIHNVESTEGGSDALISHRGFYRIFETNKSSSFPNSFSCLEESAWWSAKNLVFNCQSRFGGVVLTKCLQSDDLAKVDSSSVDLLRIAVRGLFWFLNISS